MPTWRGATPSGPPRRPRRPTERWWTALTAAVTVAALVTLVAVTRPREQPVDAIATGRERVAPPAGQEEAQRPLARPGSAETATPGRFGYSAVQPDGRSPVTYSPCRPIHYVVRGAGAPDGGAQLIAQAVADVSAASGLRFVDDGPTSEGIAQDRSAYQPDRYGDRWAPVLIAWATPDEVPDFGVDVLGEAGSTRVTRANGQHTYVTGTVALSGAAIQQYAARYGAAAGRAVVEHELGHLVGLAHVNAVRELMRPRADPAVVTLGSGDLAGLRRAGSGACTPDV